MSFNSFVTTPKHYSAVTSDIESGEPNGSNHENIRCYEEPEPIGVWSEKLCFSHSGHLWWPPNTTNSEGCFAPVRVWSQLNNNIFQIKLFCMHYHDYICIPLLCVIGLCALYVTIIFIGLLCVLFDTIFEKTMIYFIGQTLYNKNFPICSNTMYQGSDCYTTTNTVCN